MNWSVAHFDDHYRWEELHALFDDYPIEAKIFKNKLLIFIISNYVGVLCPVNSFFIWLHALQLLLLLFF